MKDLDRLVDRRLGHEHRLEPPLERRIALDVLAVLVQGRRPDHVQLAAGQRRLEHVPGVHRTLGSPGADDRVHLVDEENDLALVLGHLVDHRLQPLLELAPVLRARDQAGQVEGDEPAIGQRLRHLVVDDPLRNALDDGGLADAGIADQGWVVLRPTREDLDRLLDLARPADHRIQLSLAGLDRQITPVLVKRRRR